MEQDLTDIRNRIRAGRFSNEAAVSQGIVRRVLNVLSWPVYDTDIVTPEYSVGGRRVDYALCHPPLKPIVFIEVKQVGQSSGADRQLFEYAFHQGVQMAILTDGQEWHFFLPAERGDYGERRVYKLDILERDVGESVNRLRRYLDYNRVASGSAIDDARKDYRDIAKDREIRATLPEAWNKLIDDGDDLLIELVATTVESLCGYKPDPEAVNSFLSEKLRLGTSTVPSPAVELKTKPTGQPPLGRNTKKPKRLGAFSFVLFDQPFTATNGRDVTYKVLRALAERDAGFAERFVALPKRAGGRPYLARSPEALYPGSPHLALTNGNFRELIPKSGWFLDLHLSHRSMERVIKMACQAAGITYGADLIVHLGE
jgi:hypothetical protein